MKSNKLPLIAIGVVLLGFIVLSGFVQRVPPAKIGVKQNQWEGGILATDYQAGFHLGITGIHKWYLLDRTTHFLTFSDTNAPPRGSKLGISFSQSSFGEERPSLEIRTRDNNSANVDVSLTYRIRDGEAHMIVSGALKDVYRDRVTSTVESVLRRELAQLSSEDFYSTDTRLERAEQALPSLREALAELHVEPESLLIRAVRFPEGYEKQLQEKQLTHQKTLLATARGKVEVQLQITGRMEKEIEAAEKERRGDWDVRLQEKSSQNEVEIADVYSAALLYDKRTRATADADYETLVADGRLAVDRSEALRNELRNRALDTLGGRILLAQRAAQNLQIREVTLNSNDPSIPTVIDLPALVRLLVGTADQAQ